MKFAHFFISRPIFAIVLSLVLLILGGLAYSTLPVASYPEITPPTVVVTAVYPGANPQTLADTVATPIEEQVNGVENMLYMNSQSASDGTMTLTITFKLGTNLDVAQVLVQNRVAIATPSVAGGRAQHRRDGAEAVAQHHAGHQPALARRQVRHALHGELRRAPDPGGAQAHRGRRQRADLRRERVFHAPVAGPGQDVLARDGPRRRDRRRARRRTCRWPPGRSARNPPRRARISSSSSTPRGG